MEKKSVSIQTSGNCSIAADADFTVQSANADISADINETINGSAQLIVTGGNGGSKGWGIMAVQGSIVNI